VPRSVIPAVTHVDYSVRVQTVDADRHGRYHTLLRAFERKTGCPVLINTSFNVRGEPIVCRPAEAYRCFLATNMDVLVLENFVLLREEQSEARPVDAAEYLAQFELD
jgi:carbamoyltransferase